MTERASDLGKKQLSARARDIRSKLILKETVSHSFVAETITYSGYWVTGVSSGSAFPREAHSG